MANPGATPVEPVKAVTPERTTRECFTAQSQEESIGEFGDNIDGGNDVDGSSTG